MNTTNLLYPWNKGKKVPFMSSLQKQRYKEGKLKIGILGKSLSKETKEKISKANKGRKLNDKQIHILKKNALIRFSNKFQHPRWKGGKPHCLTCSKELSAYHPKLNLCQKCYSTSTEVWNKGKTIYQTRGEKNGMWKGGISKKYDLIRASIEWKNWRTFVFKRDKFECQFCHIINKEIHPHHIKKFSEFIDLRFNVNNGITLCIDCHNKTKWNENNYELLCNWILEVKPNCVAEVN